MSSEDFSAHCKCGGVISYVNTLKCLISLYQEAPSEICSDYKPRRDVDSSPHEGLYLCTLFKAFLVLNSICLPRLSKGFCPTRDGVDTIKEILVQDVVGCTTVVARCEYLCQLWLTIAFSISKLTSGYTTMCKSKILSTCLATLCS